MEHPSPKKVLSAHGLTAKKSFGQNFLVDDSHLQGIASSVATLFPSPLAGTTFEIGSGLGALTDALLATRLIVHAIERDRDLVPILRETFKNQLAAGQLTLHEANAMTFDFAASGPFTLCGNLPYHLTSTFLFKAIELSVSPNFLGAIFLVQKEVAERIVAKPRTKAYGMPSVLVQACFDVSLVRQVPRECFWPVPNVDSAVIALRPKADRLISVSRWPYFEKLVKAAFSQRRKKLSNNLKAFGNISPFENARAEELSVADFAQLIKNHPGT